jgi:methylamine--corrinoid protein Co-methyltransferase
MGEVGHAAARQRMSPAEANRIILSLLEKYEHVLSREGGNPGKSIEEAYDLEKLQPVEEWDSMYRDVKKELIELGIDL